MVIGAFTTGVVTPLVGYKFGLIQSSPDGDIWSNSAIWFVASVCAHRAVYVTLLG